MNNPSIVDHDAWVEARKVLLDKEKAFSQARDELAQSRRALPWEKVETDYRFTASDGRKTLADLFDGRSQLIVYHFMYGPDWDAGCPSCSYMADHFNPAVAHLAQRDITLVAASNAPIEKLSAYKDRMGWSFTWVSSLNSDFNRDFHVSFSQDEIESGPVYYNYTEQSFPSTEAPGLSVFYRDTDGSVYHTYSAYARGLDPMLTAYQYMDLTPKGRDEDSLSFPMAWIKRHDEY